MKKTSSIKKEAKSGFVISIILAALYFLGILDLDYGYYTFLRIFSFVSLFVLLALNSILSENFLNIINGIIAVMIIVFNPIFPIYLDKEVWVVIDLICGIVMVALAVVIAIKYFKKPNGEK
ncbi:MAG: hypothetical protein IJ038_02755 [Clostridia bacterium]|nr:hypothetical protein [Clostridia bacterium]